MSLHRNLTVLLCLLALALGGCGKGGSGGGNTNIRIVNVVPDAGALNITANTTTLANGIGFEGLTLYEGSPSGTVEFKVAVVGSTGNIIDQTTSINSGANYTYVVFGPSSAAANLLISDTIPTQPATGLFNFRVTNVADGAGAVDVYLTLPGANLGTSSPTIGNVAYGATTGFTTVSAGSYELRITQANTKQVIYDTGTQSFSNPLSYEAVIYTRTSGTLVNVAMLNLDSTGTGAIENNLLAQYKVVNAAPATPPLNVFVDSALTLSNIPYTGASNYQSANAGSRNFVVEAALTPGAALLTTTQNLATATDTSLVLTGSVGALNMLAFADNNLPPPLGQSRVRVINVSPDVPAVDVYANFSKQVSALVTNSASPYVNFFANTYEFDFNVSGTTTVILKLPSVVLTATNTFTIYLMGPATALQGIVVKDD